MDAVAGTSGRREILVVLALALVGVLLALLAAFTPWYATPCDVGCAAVVDVTVPAAAPDGVSHAG